MKKKVFSIKDGSIFHDEKSLQLIYFKDKFDIGFILASTDEQLCKDFNKHLLPYTLILHPKSDEELAEENFPDIITGQTGFRSTKLSRIKERLGFIAGRKSVGGEFTKNDMIAYAKWLQKEDTIENAETYFHYSDNDMLDTWLNEVRNKSIYPTSIEVEYDGTNYLWETLKANYDK